MLHEGKVLSYQLAKRGGANAMGVAYNKKVHNFQVDIQISIFSFLERLVMSHDPNNS